MASSTVWGNQVSHWRCGVSAGIASSTDQSATVEVKCVWQSIGWGFQVGYNSAWVSCGGESAGDGSVRVMSSTGETREVDAYVASFTVQRGESDRQVRVAASFTMPDYEPGSSQAEFYLTVPAEPTEAPNPPTGPRVVKTSDTFINLEWTNASDPDDHKPWTSVEVDARMDGGAWGAVPGFPRKLPGDAVSCPFVSALKNAKYEFRVRSVNAKGASAWVQSRAVYTKPAEPANVAATFSDPHVTVSWTNRAKHAEYFAVQVSSDGGRTWKVAATEAVTGLGSGAAMWSPAKDMSPPAGTSVTYRVAAVSPGGSSSWAVSAPISTYTDADYPKVTIQKPAGTVQYNPFTVAFTVEPGNGELTGNIPVELISDGAVTHIARCTKTTRSTMIPSDSVPDGSRASVRVTATNSAGLSSTAIVDFVADYLPPTDPTVTAVQSGSSAEVTAVAKSSTGHCKGTVYDAFRTGPDGVARQVAAGVECGKSFTDPTVPLNVPVTYSVTVHSAGGKTSEGSASVTVASSCAVLSFDGGGSYELPLRFEVSEGAERGGEAIHFADGGEYGGLPEWYGGPDLGCTWDVSGTVAAPVVPALRHDMRSCGTVRLRDPLGRSVRGHPSWTLAPMGSGRYWSLSATLTEVADGLV